MQFSAESLPGVCKVRLKQFSDARGEFVKTYARSAYAAADADFDIQEEFYSLSHKDVIRGMHFQLPPHDHAKAVYCAAGTVEDVLLDLRKGPGYGKFASFILSADEPSVLIIPKGLAHGFRSLTGNSLMIYKTTTEHAPTHDAGIRWDSFGFDWKLSEPIVSDRDRGHPALAEFVSPF